MASRTEDFTRGDENPFVTGSTWDAFSTETNGTGKISTNRWTPNVAGGAVNLGIMWDVTDLAFTDDQYSEIVLAGLHATVELGGPVVRGSSDRVGYYCHISGDLLELFSLTGGGGGNSLGTYAGTIGTTDTIKLEAIGTDIKVYQNGTERISVVNAVHTSGQPGIAGQGNDDAFFVESWTGSDATPPATFDAPGTLAAQDAALAGTILLEYDAPGALVAQDAALAGTVLLEYDIPGALSAQSATLAGTILLDYDTPGALAAQSATLTGACALGYEVTGGLVSGPATLSAVVSTPAETNFIISYDGATGSDTIRDHVREIRLCASTDCHFIFYHPDTPETATTMDTFLAAKKPERFKCVPGMAISAIKNTTAGTLFVTEVG